jgi:hypothetical protein
VHRVIPDHTAAEAMGPNFMAPTTAPAALRAGYRQGHALAD